MCARREHWGTSKRAEREKSIIIFGWRALTCGGVEDQKTQEDKSGVARKGDLLCFETHLLIDAISSPRFDDVKDDDDDDGEFCFGRERGFKDYFGTRGVNKSFLGGVYFWHIFSFKSGKVVRGTTTT